jgi:uncharacterized membrane protein YesL
MSFEKIVDSKAYGFFDWLYRLVVINLLTILLILPVITILPAISACNATIRDHISGNNQNTIKLYFINFIRFLESSFILWILVVGLLLISGYSIYFYSGMSQENILSQAGFYVMIFMALIIAFMAVNIPLLIINFPKLPVRGLIKATFFVTFKYPLTTLILLGLFILTLVMLPFLPISVLIGISLPSYLGLRITAPIYAYFKKIRLDEQITQTEEDNNEN